MKFGIDEFSQKKVWSCLQCSPWEVLLPGTIFTSWPLVLCMEGIRSGIAQRCYASGILLQVSSTWWPSDSDNNKKAKRTKHIRWAWHEITPWFSFPLYCKARSSSGNLAGESKSQACKIHLDLWSSDGKNQKYVYLTLVTTQCWRRSSRHPCTDNSSSSSEQLIQNLHWILQVYTAIPDFTQRPASQQICWWVLIWAGSFWRGLAICG